MGARLVWDQEVLGSTPSCPTEETHPTVVEGW